MDNVCELGPETVWYVCEHCPRAFSVREKFLLHTKDVHLITSLGDNSPNQREENDEICNDDKGNSTETETSPKKTTTQKSMIQSQSRTKSSPRTSKRKLTYSSESERSSNSKRSVNVYSRTVAEENRAEEKEEGEKENEKNGSKIATFSDFSTFAKVTDSRINPTIDDFTPNVIVLLDKLTENSILLAKIPRTKDSGTGVTRCNLESEGQISSALNESSLEIINIPSKEDCSTAVPIPNTGNVETKIDSEIEAEAETSRNENQFKNTNKSPTILACKPEIRKRLTSKVRKTKTKAKNQRIISDSVPDSDSPAQPPDPEIEDRLNADADADTESIKGDQDEIQAKTNEEKTTTTETNFGLSLESPTNLEQEIIVASIIPNANGPDEIGFSTINFNFNSTLILEENPPSSSSSSNKTNSKFQSISHPPPSKNMNNKSKYQCQCSACDDSFEFSLDLKEHLILKHSAICMIYKCLVCNRNYNIKEQLIQHMDVHCGCDEIANQSLNSDLSASTPEILNPNPIILVPSKSNTPTLQELQDANANLTGIESLTVFTPDDVNIEIVDLANDDDSHVSPVVPSIQNEENSQNISTDLILDKNSNTEAIIIDDDGDGESESSMSIVIVENQRQQERISNKQKQQNQRQEIPANETKTMCKRSPREKADLDTIVAKTTARINQKLRRLRRFGTDIPDTHKKVVQEEITSRESNNNTLCSSSTSTEKRYNVRQRRKTINYGECQICNKCNEDFLTAEELDDHAKRCDFPNGRNMNETSKSKSEDNNYVKRKLKYSSIF